MPLEMSFILPAIYMELATVLLGRNNMAQRKGKPSTPTPMEHLADRVYILRHTKRMSQHELARAVGCSPTTISNLETKKLGDISITHLVSLARVLETSADDLLGLTEDEGVALGELVSVG